MIYQKKASAASHVKVNLGFYQHFIAAPQQTLHHKIIL